VLGVPVLWRGGGPMLLGADGGRNGVAAVGGVEFAYVRAGLEFDGQTVKDVGVRYKGNGTFLNSRSSLKRPLKIDLNHFVKGQQFAGLSTINLHNGVTDPSYMNEVLSHRLYRDAGLVAPRTAYARVYVTVPGVHAREYLGLYSIVENVDKHFAAAATGAKGGAIFKPCTTSPFTDLGDDWARYKQIYDAKTDLTPAQIRRVIDFARLVTSADDATFRARVGDFLDLDQFARYMAVTAWLSPCDSILTLGQNYYVHLDAKSNRFQIWPWDLDHSFGQFGNVGTREQREQLSIHHPWRGDNRFFDRVFAAASFKTKYLAIFAELERTLFRPERFERQVDELATILRPAIEEESAEKAARFDRVVSATAPPNSIKGFVPVRAQSVAEQLAGRSNGLQLPPVIGSRGGPTGPGSFVASIFMTALDADHDGRLTKAEALAGFDRWFAEWNADQSGVLTDEQLRRGVDKDLSPHASSR
jgi:hypothetical protein